MGAERNTTMHDLEGSPAEIGVPALGFALLLVGAGPRSQHAQHRPDCCGNSQAALCCLERQAHFWKSALHWPAVGHSFREEEEEVPADDHGTVTGH